MMSSGRGGSAGPESRRRTAGTHGMIVQSTRGAAALLLALSSIPAPVAAQTAPPPQAVTAAATTSPAATPAASPLETLVSRIALYPDDLIALILPASTTGLEIVQAQQFLDARAKNSKLEVPSNFDDSLKNLLNYPTIIKMMNDDLDWTQRLGDAVVADQAAVLEAVQSFRRKVYAAGNLKSDDKQTVTVQNDVVSIAPANPQVIYVPQYNPTTVVTYGVSYGYGYYPYGYPVYYYPYAPGAAFAAGIIWGAALGAIWSGGRYACHYGYGGGNSIRINNGDINIGSGNRVNGGDRGGNRVNGGGAGGRDWKPSAEARRSTGNRIGDGPGAADRAAMGGGRGGDRMAGGAGVSDRGGIGTGNRGGGAGTGAGSVANRGGAGAGNRTGTADRAAGGGGYGPPASGASRDFSSGSRGGGDYGGGRGGSGSYGNRSSGGAFSGYNSGRSASMASSRGSMSRGFSGGGGRRR